MTLIVYYVLDELIKYMSDLLRGVDEVILGFLITCGFRNSVLGLRGLLA